MREASRLLLTKEMLEERIAPMLHIVMDVAFCN